MQQSPDGPRDSSHSERTTRTRGLYQNNTEPSRLVLAWIVTAQGTEIAVDYRMLRRGDRWMAYDVAIEGVSLVANYRTQFNRVIQSSSYRALVDKLKSKGG